MIALTDDYKVKMYVGTVAGIDDDGVHVVRREPGKPAPTYWLEPIPWDQVLSVRVGLHVPVSGLLGGIACGAGVCAMAYAVIIGKAERSLRLLKIGLILLAFFIIYVFGCRRQKAVFRTKRGTFRWVSEALAFASARQRSSEIRECCARRGIICNGRKLPPKYTPERPSR